MTPPIHTDARRMRLTLSLVCAMLWVGAMGCSGDEPGKADNDAGTSVDGTRSDGTPGDGTSVQPNEAQKAQLKAISESERWQIPGLSAEVWVVRTEANVPHIYAENEGDLARVHGFVAARDRYFLIDMMRRLGLGRLTEVFGSVALGSDLNSRGTGMSHVAERVLSMMSPEMKAVMEAYAVGINTYIALVAAKKLPPPSELKLAAPLLGYKSPSDAMKPFTLKDMAGVLTVILFQQGYETEDLRRAKVRQQLETAGKGTANAALRKKGLIDDVFRAVAPIEPVTTTPGYGVNGAGGQGAGGKTDDPNRMPYPVTKQARPLFGGHVPDSVFDRIEHRLGELTTALGKAERGEFGSNIWVVSGKKAKGGAALLASDGHLALQVPSLFWRVGIDTRVLGGGNTHQLGLTFAGMPMVGAGTNGDVAWSNTYLYSDITDYYREKLKLDSKGRPVSSRFGKEDKPLQAIDEVYEIANIALLNSVGGKQTWTRWELFDGRRLVGIEGRPATEEELAGTKKLGAGESIVAMLGDFIVPKDMDGDGTIVGISMDLTTLDVADTAGAVWGMGHSADVASFRSFGNRLVGWAQNMMVTDDQGDILYTGYNATPCRNYLERTKDGHFADDANPRLLIDGSKYRGFEIPVKDGVVDEAPGKKDPYKCIIPFDAWPVALNPKEGYIVNANNDFGNTSIDGKLGNDTWYLGGPWVLGYRAKTITDHVAAAVGDGSADVQKMSAIQGTQTSPLGAQFVPAMLGAIAKAKAAGAATGEADKRLHALYLAEQATMDVVSSRLSAWQKSGYPASSGVETFYNQPSAQDKANSVATMLFNAWTTEVLHRLFDKSGASFGAMVALRGVGNLLAGRGAKNPKNQAGWDKATGENVLFDLPETQIVERSDEVLLLALTDALTRLRAKPVEPGLGGFGTWDVDQWRWGLRHMLHLDSILASFLVGVPGLGTLTEMFAITTKTVPLADEVVIGDPRYKLLGFPRPGDYGAVDAAHPHAIRSAKFPDDGVRDFRYSHGPIMRMVIALHGDDKVEGVNILPGGQSALNDSPNFADQIRLWLANTAQPMRFSVSDVVGGAIGREVYEAAE
ncbi:MAG: penicillin acylase family protein [Myxococcales bacterium]|nr:penicillin acylase family protein [Myxococcales bacterium]